MARDGSYFDFFKKAKLPLSSRFRPARLSASSGGKLHKFDVKSKDTKDQHKEKPQ